MSLHGFLFSWFVCLSLGLIEQYLSTHPWSLFSEKKKMLKILFSASSF